MIQGYTIPCRTAYQVICNGRAEQSTHSIGECSRIQSNGIPTLQNSIRYMIHKERSIHDNTNVKVTPILDTNVNPNAHMSDIITTGDYYDITCSSCHAPYCDLSYRIVQHQILYCKSTARCEPLQSGSEQAGVTVDLMPFCQHGFHRGGRAPATRPSVTVLWQSWCTQCRKQV